MRSLGYIRWEWNARGSNTRHRRHDARAPRARIRSRAGAGRDLAAPPRLRAGDRCLALQPSAQVTRLRPHRRLPRRTEEQSEAHHQAEAGGRGGGGKLDPRVKCCQDSETSETTAGRGGAAGEPSAHAPRVQPGERAGAGALPIPGGAAVHALPPLGLVPSKCQGCAGGAPPRVGIEPTIKVQCFVFRLLLSLYLYVIYKVAVIERSFDP